MLYDSIIFDLDGTLWDACETTAKAWNEELNKLNLNINLSADDIRSVAGFPQQVCNEKLLPGLEDSHPNLIAKLTIAEQKAIHEQGGTLFPGVKEGIIELSKKYPLFIVSNCLSWYLDLFFTNSGLKKYFTDFDCVGTSGLPKYQMIEYIISNHLLKSPVYIGDTLGDQQAAQGAKIDFLHASYGFGTPKGEYKSFNSFKKLQAHLLN